MNFAETDDREMGGSTGESSPMFFSILNDVLGPVMRGPSSSHTAGSFHIAQVVRGLLGCDPTNVVISFDPDGSYGQTYIQQGVDRAFATGLMGWKQTDEVFNTALTDAEALGVQFTFQVITLPQANHPNFVVIDVQDAEGKALNLEAKSVGGGTFVITKINSRSVHLDGKSYVSLSDVIETDEDRQIAPVYYVQQGAAPLSSGQEMLAFADGHGLSLGEAVLAYETAVLGLSEEEVISEILRRYAIMKKSVADGFDDCNADMLLLEPMAGTIRENIDAKRVAIGGLHAKAAAGAMAAMHLCNSRGVVCAAPTGGAAGTIPGVLTALDEMYDISDRQMALMLFAAGGIGLILAMRATFAAEVAGCQVEIGAAGAMGSSAVVEFAGGTASQACDAAAIAFQNTMGSVCDLVAGMCELPCHTRNAAAASSSFTNADMVLGGYANPIPLDETIDAVYSTGKMLPSELRCTARGGLALTPSAEALIRSKAT